LKVDFRREARTIASVTATIPEIDAYSSAIVTAVADLDKTFSGQSLDVDIIINPSGRRPETLHVNGLRVP